MTYLDDKIDKEMEQCLEMRKSVIGKWYENIEPEVRDIVKYLRDNGVNTEYSCGRDMEVQCQYIPDGSIQNIHFLLYNYYVEKGLKPNYEIVVTHRVVDSHSYSNVCVSLGRLR